MSRSKFNNDIYDMYEKEYNKNLILNVINYKNHLISSNFYDTLYIDGRLV
ncbi:MAG TPA: hypothetical protein IAB59_02240 [Candidatus Onthousia faecipullorum]|uniref:Uncharacterized protein n=1 Tax=Candidatus Onthousia faecipullorum TaxID=2840887 RepID=A0A9D1KB82_9FIRM|nr:hypothetical protein [Candidatus Onthousia faecipullorum]